MTFDNGKDGERRRKSDQGDDAEPRDSRASPNKRAPGPEIGHALKSVYQRTIDEDIPPEMLDLLGKLG